MIQLPSENPIDNKQRLKEVIDIVLKIAGAKGWNSEVSPLDQDTFKYATIAVARRTPGTSAPVTGFFEIACDKQVKFPWRCTSVYNYGLDDLYDAIDNELHQLPWIEQINSYNSQNFTHNFAVLEKLLRNFHRVARQIKQRRENRSTIIINDEYDIQDLLHALLRGLYDDIRPEEYCPSYAGSSSRMDFLLKQEKIVIETKMPNKELRDKQIVEQLIIDIKKYQTHQDCKRLICFVYDPKGFLKNPTAIEKDLSDNRDNLEVKVIVVSV